MGKRSDGKFERKGRDFYPTPLKAVYPLGPFLNNKTYIEPFAGDGALVNHIKKLQPNATCSAAYDIEPQATHTVDGIEIIKRDTIEQPVLKGYKDYEHDVDCFVSNPPFLNTKASGFQLNKIIEEYSSILPTWLLLPSDFAMNKKSAVYMKMCTDVVPIGRVTWIEGTKMNSADNFCWYRFNNTNNETQMTYLHPRG